METQAVFYVVLIVEHGERQIQFDGHGYAGQFDPQAIPGTDIEVVKSELVFRFAYAAGIDKCGTAEEVPDGVRNFQRKYSHALPADLFARRIKRRNSPEWEAAHAVAAAEEIAFVNGGPFAVEAIYDPGTGAGLNCDGVIEEAFYIEQFDFGAVKIFR